MFAFHEAHFSEMDTFGIGKDKLRLVQFFNRVGKSRRRRVLRPNRSFTFTSIIYNSELQRIAAGVDVYHGISRAVRKRCLDNLASILTEPSLKMDMVVVDDTKAVKIKIALRDYETLGVVGEVLSMWNYHSGSIGWSEHPKYVSHHRNLLGKMQRCAFCGTRQETAEYITGLVATT